jgi:hypothetical protein
MGTWTEIGPGFSWLLRIAVVVVTVVVVVVVRGGAGVSGSFGFG